VYLTARPRRYDQLTHRWLAAQGMPRGPIIESPGLTLPGHAALEVKTRALADLRAAGFRVVIGIGNRATDVKAYAGADIPPDRIFIEATQYATEVQALAAQGRATAFTSYDELRRLVLERLPRL
jgi:phosphatidate phosphatase PAH1